MGLGSTRQASSHIKACVGFGFTVLRIEGIIKMANELSQWNGVKLGSSIDVEKLASDARAEISQKD